ncbi:metal ABC transporter solute-binding protein, Zn/Mn family [Ruoffia tabacinasalis]|uniref:Zinc ABC transporter substrate-binding protein n=1 Tax=Ruoffia tabacinasalis TaxID=87458 RepID=A0ABS0LHI2_9LACT|nr:zinc ABC transporter substrate-binding protein [Ruoffia tabacinasalis]MBG9977693.1 zinc ABC transporter substrate-binding protein [Ruoffia tabacinasalis]
MKLFKKFILFIVAFALIVPGVSVHAQDKKTVMTTFYPMYYLASRIGGEAINVEMLLESGQDAHSYESTAKDAVAVQEADLFIYQDDEMEFFVSDLLSIVDQEATQVLESTEGIELLSGDHNHEEEEHDHEHEEGHEEEHDHEHDHEHEEGHSHEFDPHTWLDPNFYSQQAENVKNALIELDPANEATYTENAAKLSEELTALNEEFNVGLADLENRTIVVQHEAFGYLAHAYDLEQLAISGLANNAEPSAKQLAEMTNVVNERNIQVIYVDPTTSTTISETVSQATGAELRPLRTLEFITEEEIEQGEDYFSIMRENLAQLTK